MANYFIEVYVLDDLKMAAQAVQFFSAGNETTSLTLAITMYELAINKNVQYRQDSDKTTTTFLPNPGNIQQLQNPVLRNLHLQPPKPRHQRSTTDQKCLGKRFR